MRLEPRLLLGIADEMAGLTGEREPEAALAVFAAHAALEAFVNEIGTQEIASFNLRARFLPKWHDVCARVLGRQLDSGLDLERIQAIRDALVGYVGEPERLDRRDASPPPAIPETLSAEIALWAVDAARRVMAEFYRVAGRSIPAWIG